jgi:eukaryotic-like serine/threonine-protein kinase
MDDAPNLDPMAGVILSDRYRILRILGSGAMGQVYEAEQLGLGRSVAVKLMRSGFDDDGEVERFRTEALAASRINHPHAVAIFDFGLTETSMPFLVMERLRGRPLSAHIAEHRLSASRAVTIGAQILSAAAEAHSCGVVHRDLKSDNVVVDTMRDGSDFAKVLDFGLAQLVDVPTTEAGISGTPEYMAPEQIRGEHAAPSADLYAIGVILYEMLVGSTPFAGGSIQGVLARHLTEAPVAPHRRVPDCPPALSAMVMRALEKDPARRFADAQTMRDALRDALRDAPAVIEFDEPGAMAVGSQPALETEARDTLLRLGSGIAIQPTELSIRPRMVGRSSDAALVARFLRGDATASALAVVGPQGVGKTRLVLEVAAELEGEIALFVAAPDPSGLAQPWRPVLSMLEAVLGVTPDPTIDELTEAVTRCQLPERDVPGLAELFALPGPLAGLELAPRRREAQAAALRALSSVHLHRSRATLCFFDVDHYDAPSRALIATLAEAIDGSPVRLIVTCEDQELAPPAAAIHALEPLSPHDTFALAASLIGAASTSMPPITSLHQATGGLPTAIEHLAAWLRAGHDLASAPDRLVDLVAVRLGQLSVPERRTLQAIAAEGKIAARARVAAFIGAGELEPALRGLQAAGFVAATEHELTIPFELIADVALACTPADMRRELSRSLLASADRGTPPAVIGHHAERANDLSLAAEQYLLAGDDAVRRFDDPGAARWYLATMRVARRIASQGDDAGPVFITASLRLADVLRFTGELKLAAGCLDEAEFFAPDLPHQAGLARARGRIALAAGDGARARRHLGEAIGLAYRRGDREFLGETYLDLAAAICQAGELAAAITELTEAIDALTLGEGLAAASHPPRLWQVGLRLAELHLKADDRAAARAVARAGLAQAERVGSEIGQGRLHALLATIEAGAGDERTALRHRAHALEHLRRLGDRRSIAELLLLCATPGERVHKATGGQRGGDPGASIRALELAHDLAREVGWSDGMQAALRARDTLH